MTAHENVEIPDLVLEQYRLNELPPEQARRLERLASESETLRQRLDALNRSDAQIARQYPPAWMADRVRERAARGSGTPSRSGARVRQWGIPAAVGIAAVALVVGLPHRSMSPSPDAATTVTETDRIKGLQPSLAVYRRSDRGTETLADGDVARSGDLLRLGYTAAGRAYGVIVSIDGRGAVTLHLPPKGTHAASLGHSGQVLLDQAYELDDAPNWERFYFVTGDTAFDVAPILDAARRAAGRSLQSPPAELAIPAALTQSTFSLQKEVKP